MEIIRKEVNTVYRGIALRGICYIIPPTTYMVTMESPYKGLSAAEYFYKETIFNLDNMMGRIRWKLGALYEQHADIQHDYPTYKRLWDEWEPYQQHINRLKEEATDHKRSADQQQTALLDFQLEMLSQEEKEHFTELMEKHGIMPCALSPENLAISMNLIENKGGSYYESDIDEKC